MLSNPASSLHNILFELRHVTKAYQGNTAISDLSLTLKSGQWLGILGESGSGKSTLLQIAARFIDADTGDVLFNREVLPDVASLLLKGHPDIKLVHQEYQLFPRQTVRENITYPIRFQQPETIRKRTEQLLGIAALEEVQHQKAGLLSGGEKQRTAIAAALSLLPQLLLLDEPFAHLDGLNRARLNRLFRSLKSVHRQSCIFVTHDPAEALDWADHLIVLRNGRIVQSGSPQEIYEFPADAYVAELTGNVNWLDKKRTVWIRPEKMRVSRQKTTASLHTLRIRSAHFRGIHWQYEGTTAGGLSFILYRLRNDLSPGQEVYLRYSEKDVRGLPAPPAKGT